MTEEKKEDADKLTDTCTIYLRFVDLAGHPIEGVQAKVEIDGESEVFEGTTTAEGEIGSFITQKLLKKIHIYVKKEETKEWKKIGESFTEPGRKRIHVGAPKIKGETKLKFDKEQYVHEITCKEAVVVKLEPEPRWLEIARAEERKCVAEIGKAIKDVASKAYDKQGTINSKKSAAINSQIQKEFENPDILKYHRSTTESGAAKNDETAWCSAFVNWVMQQAGYQGTKFAGAWSWRSLWPAKNTLKSKEVIDREGKKIDKPCYGCIAVIVHPNGQGHVGFIVGKFKEKLIMLGGNQSDMLRYMPISTDGLTFLVPSNYTPPENHFNLPEVTGVGQAGGTR